VVGRPRPMGRRTRGTVPPGKATAAIRPG
jgi:hypothetical protein